MLLVVLASWVAVSEAHAEGTLAGLVTYPGGAPAAGVEVDINPANPIPGQSFPRRQAITDPKGQWTYSPLPAGSYQVLYEVVLGNGDNETQAVEQVTLGEGQQATLDATLSGPEGPGVATFSGRVLAADGLPAGNATLSFTSSAGWAPLPSPADVVDSTGAFTVLLPAGAYSLTISREVAGAFSESDSAGPESLAANVTLAAGQTTTASYTLPAPTPLATPSGINASNATRDLEYLNAERTRWGLPAGIAFNPTWSQACAAHDTYLADNDLLEHPENESLPGYSPGGYWAGTHSILAEGSVWTTQANPWEDAPIHLDQLYTADLDAVGIDESRGYACTTTWPGIGPPASPLATVLTYPGNGTSGLPPAENARESPFVPGKFVGLPEGTIAGRELFVYEEQAPLTGPCSGFCLARAPSISAASLTSASGPVEVRWVDAGTEGIGSYLTGAIVIPVKPLAADTAYRASVTLEADLTYGVPTVVHEWTFTTGAANPAGAWPGAGSDGGGSLLRSVHGERPLLKRLGLFPTAFAAAPRAARSAAAHVGATVSYLDSVAATTTFIVLRRLPGVVRDRACRTRSAREHKGRACARYVPVYAFARRDRAGVNRFHFSGRGLHSELAPGRYELRATARLAGASSPDASAHFRILR